MRDLRIPSFTVDFDSLEIVCGVGFYHLSLSWSSLKLKACLRATSGSWKTTIQRSSKTFQRDLSHLAQHVP